MSYADVTYHELLRTLLTKAEDQNLRPDRTGTGTVSIFGYQMRFNLAEGFPLLTTKEVHFPSVVTELLWFLKGDTNIKYLLEHKNRIWTDWRLKEFNESRASLGKREVSKQEFEECVRTDDDFAKSWGSIGKGYGHQWRNFGQVFTAWIPVEKGEGTFTFRKAKTEVELVKGFDQISWVINEIKDNPTSRRLIVSGWNPHEVDKVDLPPCHTLFQFYVEPMSLNERKHWVDANYAGGGLKAITEHSKAHPNEYPIPSSSADYRESHIRVCDFVKAPTHKLSCQLYQRSADVFLGLPFNIASYALLTLMIAQTCGLGLGDFVWTGGDTHLYSNHLEQAKEQLLRDPTVHLPPKVSVADKPIFELEPQDIKLMDYSSFSAIKAPVAV